MEILSKATLRLLSFPEVRKALDVALNTGQPVTVTVEGKEITLRRID